MRWRAWCTVFGALLTVGVGAWWLLTDPPPPEADLLFERPDRGSERLSALVGRPVVLHLWATWCEPCREELPALLTFAEQANGWHVVAAAVDDSMAALGGFEPARRGDGLHPAVVRTALGPVARQYNVAALPVTLLFDAEGRLVQRWGGPQEWARDMAPVIEDALARGGPAVDSSSAPKNPRNISLEHPSGSGR